jgi:hypothetical protein
MPSRWLSAHIEAGVVFSPRREVIPAFGRIEEACYSLNVTSRRASDICGSV